MRVHRSELHKLAVVDSEGELGIRTMVDIKNATRNLMREGFRIIVLNCRAVERIQAMSVGVLVEQLCRAREIGGTLVLADVHPQLFARLRELRVESLFQTFRSVSDALVSLAGLPQDAVVAA
jgi:anti-anti-sigma factor